MMQDKHGLTILRFLCVVLCMSLLCAVADAQPENIDPWTMKELIGRGINSKNRVNGEPGYWEPFTPGLGRVLKDAGFDSVRVWAFVQNNDSGPPHYTLKPAFWNDMDKIVNDYLNAGLVVILVMRELDVVEGDMNENERKFVKRWEQVAAHYKDCSAKLVFELMNEARESLNTRVLNKWYEAVVPKIRATNPTRNLIFAGGEYQNPKELLYKVEIPSSAGDNYLGTFHSYIPTDFTGNGNTAWTGSRSQKREVRRWLDFAKDWSDMHKKPVVCTEWGANRLRPIDERVAWVKFHRDELLARGFAFSYFTFNQYHGGDGDLFAIYNDPYYGDEKQDWVYPQIRDALLEPTSPVQPPSTRAQ